MFDKCVKQAILYLSAEFVTLSSLSSPLSLESSCLGMEQSPADTAVKAVTTSAVALASRQTSSAVARRSVTTTTACVLTSTTASAPLARVRSAPAPTAERWVITGAPARPLVGTSPRCRRRLSSSVVSSSQRSRPLASALGRCWSTLTGGTVSTLPCHCHQLGCGHRVRHSHRHASLQSSRPCEPHRWRAGLSCSRGAHAYGWSSRLQGACPQG